ncbi:hypothetical protein [Streptomyces lanatus]|uniref:Uncharacterized protein n=1 Tax=Streptomyces lanatus TaxID=66900 RepID=A0ABV1Y0J9_9ACTN|nr:hypothetical protein [Streptomyces lanatus]
MASPLPDGNEQNQCRGAPGKQADCQVAVSGHAVSDTASGRPR